MVSYRTALWYGYEQVKTRGMLTSNIIIEIQGIIISRKTAMNYLNALEKEGFLTSEKIGKERIYQNKRLYDLVKNNKEA